MKQPTVFRQLAAVAAYELRTLLHSRWLAAFAVLFALLNMFMLIWEARLMPAGGDASGFTRQAASQMNLMLQLAPLMSLTIASLSLASERNDGMTGLLRTYPLPPACYILGKFFGLFGAFLLTLLVGFGIAQLLGLFLLPRATVSHTLPLLAMGIALCGICSAIGLWIGGRVQSRLGAVAASLLIWFVSVYVYSMVLLAALPFAPTSAQQPVLAGALVLNPVEAVRIASVFWRGDGYIFGPAFYYWEQWFNSAAGIATAAIVVLLYVAIPLHFAAARIRRGRG